MSAIFTIRASREVRRSELLPKLRHIVQIGFFALLVRPFLTLFIGLRIYGHENLPKGSPFILIANHSSHLDAVSLLSLFPLRRLPKIRPCAAADYFERNRWISFASHMLFNILPIVREKLTPQNHPVRLMKEALLRGESLVLFPEGTRGRGDTMAAFQPGIAHLVAEAPRVPVVPVYLRNMGRVLPRGEVLPVPFFGEIRVGKPRVVSGTRKEILKILEGSVLELRGLGVEEINSKLCQPAL